jgi:hypothetical protein
MKPNLLEQLIKKALLEQAEKTVIINPMSKSERNDVIAAGGITGFTITMKYRGQAPSMESILPRLKNQIAANSQIGANSSYDVADKSDNVTSRYMYVIGDDIAKSKRILKMNVWVLLYSPLYQLATQIDRLKKNNRYQEQLTGVIEWYAGSIPVYTYNDAAKWIAILKTQSSNLKLELRDNQLKKKIAFPNLATINKQELDQEKISGETKIVTIDNTNRQEYDDTSFTGTAEISYDAYGKRKLTRINGSHPVRRESDGMRGIYTGEFVNGMPSNGKVVWNDGEVWEGEMSSTAELGPNTGNVVGYNFVKSKNTKVSNSKQTSTDQVSPDSETSNENDVITYPYTTKKGELIYTRSDSDPWVYANVDNEWLTAKKSEFESNINGGPDPKFLEIKNKTAISTLNKLANITPITAKEKTNIKPAEKIVEPAEKIVNPADKDTLMEDFNKCLAIAKDLRLVTTLAPEKYFKKYKSITNDDEVGASKFFADAWNKAWGNDLKKLRASNNIEIAKNSVRINDTATSVYNAIKDGYTYKKTISIVNPENKKVTNFIINWRYM